MHYSWLAVLHGLQQGVGLGGVEGQHQGEEKQEAPQDPEHLVLVVDYSFFPLRMTFYGNISSLLYLRDGGVM